MPRPGRPRPLRLLLGVGLSVAASAGLVHGQQAPIPECGAVVVTSNRCDFRNHRRGYASAALHRPAAHVMDVQSATVTRVPFAGNGLRQLLEATFAADPANSGRYLAPPDVTVAVTPAGGAAASATGSLVPDIGRSVAADRVRYRVRVEQGDRSFGRLPTGPCTLAIRVACADPRTCPAGQADFGAGCEAATAAATVCPDGEAKFGGGACVPASDCPVGQASFGDGAGCVAAAEASECAPRCSYADATCAAGAVCPGGTLVSAECADRSAFAENPCACTALQELAALSSEDPDGAASKTPWNDLRSNAYCNMGVQGDYDYYAEGGLLRVKCATSDGVQVPVFINGVGAGLAGALPPSLGDLGPSLTFVDLGGNPQVPSHISSLPTEIGALTGLVTLDLDFNDLTSLPTEVGALTGLKVLGLYDNAITSLPTELGALTGLTFVDLYDNAITSLLSDIGALTALTNLDLGSNAITSLPSELGALTGLERLNLYGNAITSVPSELGALAGLTYLDLDRNAITSVPTELAALTGLTYLDLDRNKLTGVPEEFRTVNPSSYCDLSVNPGFSCANVGAGTTCCTTNNNCGEGLSGGPCYTG